MYAHRRMAITGDDVSLDDIMPISYDFAVVEGKRSSVLIFVGGNIFVIFF